MRAKLLAGKHKAGVKYQQTIESPLVTSQRLSIQILANLPLFGLGRNLKGFVHPKFLGISLGDLGESEGVGSCANWKSIHDFLMPLNTKFCSYLPPFGRNFNVNSTPSRYEDYGALRGCLPIEISPSHSYATSIAYTPCKDLYCSGLPQCTTRPT